MESLVRGIWGLRVSEAERVCKGCVKFKTVTEIRRSCARDTFTAESIYLVLYSLYAYACILYGIVQLFIATYCVVSCNYSLQYNVGHRATIYCNILIGIVLLFIVVCCMASFSYLLYHIIWHCATSYCIVWHYATIHYSILYGTVRLFIAIYCMAPCDYSLQYIVWHRIALISAELTSLAQHVRRAAAVNVIVLSVSVYHRTILVAPCVVWLLVPGTGRQTRVYISTTARGLTDNSLYNNNGSGTDRQTTAYITSTASGLTDKQQSM